MVEIAPHQLRFNLSTPIVNKLNPGHGSNRFYYSDLATASFMPDFAAKEGTKCQFDHTNSPISIKRVWIGKTFCSLENINIW